MLRDRNYSSISVRVFSGRAGNSVVLYAETVEVECECGVECGSD